MRYRRLPSVTAVFVVILLSVFQVGGYGVSVQPGYAQAAQSDTQPAPSAFLDSKNFEFDPVPEGTSVIHDFIIYNRGTLPLNIHKVRTG
jgi:hypothetical protein